MTLSFVIAFSRVSGAMLKVHLEAHTDNYRRGVVVTSSPDKFLVSGSIPFSRTFVLLVSELAQAVNWIEHPGKGYIAQVEVEKSDLSISYLEFSNIIHARIADMVWTDLGIRSRAPGTAFIEPVPVRIMLLSK